MKSEILKYFLLSNFILAALAKGGGGGGGGGKGGGSSGGSSSGSSGGSSSGSSGGSSSGSRGGSSGGTITGGGSGTFSQPKTGSVSSVGSYNFPSGSSGYSRGGYGTYNSAYGSGSRNTRGTYTNYYPTYGGGYGYGYPYGWYGGYNPAFLYWAVIPLGFYAGYHTTYSRYNAQEGAYYAPMITSQNSGTQDVMINGTAYTDDTNNFHYTFGVVTSTGRPALDSAFFASSDYNASPADFAYRLTFWQLVEFSDTNGNGILDDGEPVSGTIPLQGGWSTIQISNKTSPANSSLTYLEGQTTTFVNASNHAFNATLVFRVSNVQINNTFALTYEPNSIEYEFSVTNYQLTNPANRVALLQALSYNSLIPTATDINSTTSANIAAQIKTNTTYGASIGPYSEGRLEYSNQLNLTNVTFGSYVSDATQQVQGSLTPIDQWIWNGVSPNGTSILAVTLPLPNNGSTTQTVAGFAFLDVDVLGLGASSAGNSVSLGRLNKVSTVALAVASAIAITVLL